MNSPKTNNDLSQQLTQIGLRATAAGLDDLIARASRGRWSVPQLLQEIARSELEERQARNLAQRMAASAAADWTLQNDG